VPPRRAGIPAGEVASHGDDAADQQRDELHELPRPHAPDARRAHPWGGPSIRRPPRAPRTPPNASPGFPSPLIRATAIAIVVLVAALAVLGRSSSGTPSPLVALGKLVGGMVLLGTCIALAFAGTLATPPRTGRLHGPTAAATALVGLAILSGACLGALSPAAPAAALTAHLVIGWLLPIAWAGLAGRAGASPQARRASALAAVLLVAVTALATLGPARADSPLAAWLHNGLAAATLCAAIAALARSRA